MPREARSVKKRAATLADVGREAGVSVMAVSAVINGARTSTRISAETRDRILAAASKLQYRPNAAARALADRRMNTIGVVTRVDSGELNHYFIDLFNGILETAAAHKQNTTVFALEDWDQNAERLTDICDGRIDGAILLAPQFYAKKTVNLPEHTPFVTIHANLDIPGSINLETDEERGAEMITQHLISQGHSRILHLAGPFEFRGAQRRLRGFRTALAEAGIPYDPDLVLTASFSSASAHQAIGKWLDENRGKPLPHAIFCANDTMAIGCMEALAERGLRVPEQISICGFDDIVLCRSTSPPLTTVRQPLREMGCKATELLLESISNRSVPHYSFKNLVFPTELVLRASIGPRPDEVWLVP